MRLKESIEHIFGPRACSHALFYARPGGLRFELSEGESPLDQVLSALRKATAICDDIFQERETLAVCLRQFASSTPFDSRATLRELALAGIRIPRQRALWLDPTPPEDRFEGDTESWWINVAFELPKTKLQNLLWCAVTADFGAFHPNPYCRVYLINLADELIAHPYDHRGMDVIGPNHALLVKLYTKHNRLLLDHDRRSMDATFSPAAELG
jgi:hypothetical protein